MTSNEFQELIIQELNNHKIPTHNSNNEEVNYHPQDFYAINMELGAETFDVKGRQIWITIPCPDFPKWKFQINIRTWEKADFRYYSKDINSFSVSFLVLYNWNAIGYYTFIDRNNKLKEKRTNVQYIKKIHLPHSKNRHYVPDESFYKDYISDWISLTKNCIEMLNKDNLLQNYSEAKTEVERKRIYSKEIKPIIKIHFDEYFSIR